LESGDGRLSQVVMIGIFVVFLAFFFLNGKYIIINIQVSAKAKRSLLPKQTKNFFKKKQRNRTKKIKNKTASK
jgi:hypothetical protein